MADPPMKHEDVVAMHEFMHGQRPVEAERSAFDEVLQFHLAALLVCLIANVRIGQASALQAPESA
jgi:hypothetical protein